MCDVHAEAVEGARPWRGCRAMDMPERRTFLADVEAAGEEGSDLDGCHAMEGSCLSLSSLLFLFVQVSNPEDRSTSLDYTSTYDLLLY